VEVAAPDLGAPLLPHPPGQQLLSTGRLSSLALVLQSIELSLVLARLPTGSGITADY